MNTFDVIRFLLNYYRITGDTCDTVFTGSCGCDKYDIYMDDYSKDIFIDKFDSVNHRWEFQSNISNYDFNVLIKIENWK